jgi:translation initiation factor 2 beta subunit (eIF-2beta)/eIF-5
LSKIGILNLQGCKKSENKFVIPVLEKNSKSESDSEADIDIDYYSDPEPCYNLMEEKQQVLQEYTSEIESSNYDDEFYMSFFVKN